MARQQRMVWTDDSIAGSGAAVVVKRGFVHCRKCLL